MKIKFEWEKINSNLLAYTYRAKVFGGWLVNTFTYDKSLPDVLPRTESSVFIPDIYHEWKIK